MFKTLRSTRFASLLRISRVSFSQRSELFSIFDLKTPEEYLQIEKVLAKPNLPEFQKDFGRVFNFLILNFSQINSASLGLLVYLCAQIVHNPKEFKQLLDFLVVNKLPARPMQQGAIKGAFIRLVKDMNVNHYQEILPLLSALKIVVNPISVHFAISRIMSSYDPEFIFKLFFESGLLWHCVFYNIKATVDVFPFFSKVGKPTSLHLLKQGGIVPDASIKQFFGMKQSENCEITKIMSNYSNALTSSIPKLDSFLLPKLHKRLRNNFDLFDLFPKALATKSQKIINAFHEPILDFLNDQGFVLTQSTSPLDVYRAQVFIFTRFFNFFDNSEPLSKENHEFTQKACVIFEEFLKRTLLTEDIEINFSESLIGSQLESKLGRNNFKVAEENLNEKDLETLLSLFSLMVRKNIGTGQLVNFFYMLFEKFFNKIPLPMKANLLYLYAELNIAHQPLSKKLLELTESKNLSDEFTIPILYFLIVSSQFDHPAWSYLENKINLLGRTVLLPKDSMICFLASEILIENKNTVLKSLKLVPPEGLLLFSPSKFSDSLDFYFKHLYVKGMESNVEFNGINIHYKHEDLCLLAFERDLCAFNIPGIRGVPSLAVTYLRSKFQQVGYVSENGFAIHDKRNKKMHDLRKQIKDWKIDFDKREAVYDAPYDEVYGENFNQIEIEVDSSSTKS